MLSPEHRNLISAAVDGELSSSARSALNQLLRDSEAARSLLARLQKDSKRIKRLSRVPAPPQFAAKVVETILDNGMTPIPLPPVRHRADRIANRINAIAGLAFAASLFLGVALVSYQFFIRPAGMNEDHASGEPTAVAEGPKTVEQVPGRSVAQQPAGTSDNLKTKPSSMQNNSGAPIEQPHTQELAMQREVLPQPREHNPQDLTAPPSKDFEGFQIAPVRMALIFPLRDLDEPYPKQKLAEALKPDEAIRLDLFFTRDGIRAYEQIQAALKAKGHNIVVDPFLQDRLKKKLPTEILFFSEGFSPKDVAQLLEKLGTDDKKAEAKKSSDGVFDRIVVSPFVQADQDRLAKLLGVTSSHLKLLHIKGSSSTENRRPLESATAAQVASNLTSKGSSPTGSTLILAYSPANVSPASSKEIKAFLEKRGDHKAGSTPFMLVLRTSN